MKAEQARKARDVVGEGLAQEGGIGKMMPG